MMFTSDSMELVSLVVFKDKGEAVSAYLLSAGFFHPVDIRNIENELKSLSQVQIERDSEKFERLQLKTRELAGRLGARLAPARDVDGVSSGNAEAVLAAIEAELLPLTVKRDEYAESVKTNEAILSQVKDFLPFPVSRERGYSFLQVSLGTIEEKNILVLERSLTDVPHVLYPFSRRGNRVNALFLGLRRDRQLINKVLADVGWQEEEFPKDQQMVSREAQKRLAEQIGQYREKIQELEGAIARLRQSRQAELERIYAFASLNKSLLEAKRFAVATEKTMIFSGWVPAEDKEQLFAEVKRIADSSYVEAREPEETGVAKEDIPVRFAQNPLLKPFGLLVDSYGVPRYGTIDPTIFVAISFLLMFGAMFGDLGQGLVLALLGALMMRHRSAGARQAGTLLMYCGLSAAVFGFLFGSAFGIEFHSLWKKPLENVMGLLQVSVYAGIAVVSLGIVINVINSLKDRNYLKALFDKAGLIGGMVYWAAIVVVIRQMFEKLPVPAPLYWLIAGGMGLLFLFPMVEFFLHHHHGGNFFESFMESLLGLLEFVMGYLANTVSFVRMGAFTLAHASLFLAVFQISEMFQGVGSVVVIVLGNIGIIVLEGVVVAIQSLRLNYYEFFSKFFMTGKTVFKPLSVKAE